MEGVHQVVLVVLLVALGTSGKHIVNRDLDLETNSSSMSSPCPGGTYGPQCERQCHCMMTPCDALSENATCPHGCQRGWLGEACDIARIKPQVSYYCVRRNADNTNSINHLTVSVKTNGIESVSLDSMDNGTVTGSCRTFRKYRDAFRPSTPHETILTIRVDVLAPTRVFYDGSQSKATHQCRDSFMMGDNIKLSWLLSVRESSRVVLENDLEVIMTCDFSRGVHRSVVDQYTVMDVPAETHLQQRTQKILADDVSLTLIDVSTGTPVKTAALGTPVQLRLSYGLQEGSPIKAVRPRDCFATSGTERTRILDNQGCSTSPVSQFKKTSEQTMETEWFPLFNVNGYKNMTIQCIYDFCFREDQCQQNDCSRGKRDVTNNAIMAKDEQIHIKNMVSVNVQVL